MGGIIAPSIASAKGNNDVQRTEQSQSNNSDNDSQNLMDEQMLNIEDKIANTLNTLSSTDKQDCNNQAYLQNLTNKMNLMTGNINKVDPLYIQEHQFDNFGKLGITAKVAGKLLKVALHKLGRREYNKIAKASGLDLIKMNYSHVLFLADYIGNFNGKVGSVLKRALMKYFGFNSFYAGLTAGTIVTVFL